MEYRCLGCQELKSYAGQWCCDCRNILERIRQQNRIAENAGTPHDLTLTQWFQTVKHYKGLCAYCGKSPNYILIEHFIPVSLGGGTTIGNCVPACNACNVRKRNLHPSQVHLIPQEALERVRVFLESQKLASK